MAPNAHGRRASYKLVCFSLYHEDIARLEQLVGELKRRGLGRVSKSQVVRMALEAFGEPGSSLFAFRSSPDDP
jgi:hypothetical protein